MAGLSTRVWDLSISGAAYALMSVAVLAVSGTDRVRDAVRFFETPVLGVADRIDLQNERVSRISNAYSKLKMY
jgi:hypothetical protein